MHILLYHILHLSPILILVNTIKYFGIKFGINTLTINVCIYNVPSIVDVDRQAFRQCMSLLTVEQTIMKNIQLHSNSQSKV